MKQGALAQASQHSVAAALEACRGRRALLIGDLVLDAYVYGETVRVSREAPVLVVRKERTEYRLGGAANTAANLAALGVRTTVVSALADDDGGRTLRGMLTRSGVDVRCVGGSDVSTSVKTRVLAGASGTSRQQVLRIDDEPARAPGDEVREQLARDLVAAAADVDVIVVSDYGQGAIGGVVIEALRGCIRDGHKVCVDSRYSIDALRGATAITPNTPEAEALVGFALNTPEAVERGGRALLESVGCEVVLLTQGRRGMSLFRAGQATSHVDIVGEDEVTDVTGAGDTVMATFSAALAAGLGAENGMRLANVAAGVVVTKMGTATASPAEISAAAALHSVELSSWPLS